MEFKTRLFLFQFTCSIELVRGKDASLRTNTAGESLSKVERAKS